MAIRSFVRPLYRPTSHQRCTYDFTRLSHSTGKVRTSALVTSWIVTLSAKLLFSISFYVSLELIEQLAVYNWRIQSFTSHCSQHFNKHNKSRAESTNPANIYSDRLLRTFHCAWGMYSHSLSLSRICLFLLIFIFIVARFSQRKRCSLAVPKSATELAMRNIDLIPLTLPLRDAPCSG